MSVLDGQDPHALALAVQRLAKGDVVAIPTETVYGLAGRCDDDRAVALIFSTKGRPVDHPLIVHVADEEAARFFARDLSEVALRLMRHFWPGPLTLVVSRREGRAQLAAAGRDTVALRCPDHPVAQQVLRLARDQGIPGLAAPSANRFGRVSPTRAQHVVAEFGPELMVVDGGPCREGIESAIVDCSRLHPYLLRPGTLSRQELEAAAGEPVRQPDALSPRVSGSLAAHYAPAAQVQLCSAQELASRWQHTPIGEDRRLGVYSRHPPPEGQGVLWRQMPDNANQVASELFDVLRNFDDSGAQAIWVESPPSGAEWEGVRDRLQRAAAS